MIVEDANRQYGIILTLGDIFNGGPHANDETAGLEAG